MRLPSKKNKTTTTTFYCQPDQLLVGGFGRSSRRYSDCIVVRLSTGRRIQFKHIHIKPKLFFFLLVSMEYLFIFFSSSLSVGVRLLTRPLLIPRTPHRRERRYRNLPTLFVFASSVLFPARCASSDVTVSLHVTAFTPGSVLSDSVKPLLESEWYGFGCNKGL